MSDRDSPPEQYVIIEDETLAQGFTQIPNGVLRRSDLQPGAKLTYMVLLSYAWQKDHAYPGQERLAKDMGVSERSVITYLQQLQQSGLVTIRRRGLGMTNIYVINRISGSAKSALQEPKQGRSAKSAVPEVQDPTAPDVQDLPPKKTQRKDSERKGSTGRTVTSSLSLEDRAILRRYAADYATEFRDEASLDASTGRLINLFADAGIDLDTFIDLMQEARQITQRYSGSIRKQADDGSGMKLKMPYFLSTLEDVINKHLGR